MFCGLAGDGGGEGGREGGRAIKWATGVHHEMLPGHVMSSAVRASSEQIASKADRSHEGGREGGGSRVRIEWLSFLSIGANQRQSQYKDLQQNRLQIASVSERIEGTRDRGMQMHTGAKIITCRGLREIG